MQAEQAEHINRPNLSFLIKASTLITIVLMPALFMFSTAVNETGQYIMPLPAPSIVVVNSTGETFTFYVTYSSLTRVATVWTLVGILLVLAGFILLLVWNIYAQVMGMGRISGHSLSYASGKDRILQRQQELQPLLQRFKSQSNDNDDDEESGDEETGVERSKKR